MKRTKPSLTAKLPGQVATALGALLMLWLIMALALTVERLYRIRYLHRGNHRKHDLQFASGGGAPSGSARSRSPWTTAWTN